MASESKLDTKTFFQMIERVKEQFPNIKMVGTTLREVVQLDPQAAAYHRALAQCYLEQGHIAEAITECAIADTCADRSAELPYIRGMIAERRLRHGEALQQYGLAHWFGGSGKSSRFAGSAGKA